jgi:hypothetical protein
MGANLRSVHCQNTLTKFLDPRQEVDPPCPYGHLDVGVLSSGIFRYILYLSVFLNLVDVTTVESVGVPSRH